MILISIHPDLSYFFSFFFCPTADSSDTGESIYAIALSKDPWSKVMSCSIPPGIILNLPFKFFSHES